VLYDNMRTVVLQRHGYGRGRHRFHPGFLDFARHCGFQPRLCAPYRAQTTDEIEQLFSNQSQRRPSHPFVRSQLRLSLRPDLAPARALRTGAVGDAACGTGEAGAKRPRRRRAQCYAAIARDNAAIPSRQVPSTALSVLLVGVARMAVTAYVPDVAGSAGVPRLLGPRRLHPSVSRRYANSAASTRRLSCRRAAVRLYS
jgi:hypothetical protein